ncbi:MAG: ABC transporter permease [Halomonas sp.]
MLSALSARLRALHGYRGFIAASVHRDFHSRYAGSQIGMAWAVIQPFSLIFIYTVIFATVLHPRLAGHQSPLAYSIYLCAGLLTWTFFSDLLGRATGMFVANAGLLKHIHFPIITLPVINILSALIHFAIILVIFFGVLLLSGFFPGLLILAAVPVLAVLIAFAIGLGLLAGILNVFYRDIEQAIGIVLQFWFWLTPIVYPASILPDTVKGLLPLNPLYPVFTAMQGLFLEQRLPHWPALLYPLSLALLLLALARRAYRHLGPEIVDQL